MERSERPSETKSIVALDKYQIHDNIDNVSGGTREEGNTDEQ
jgi:hypothetical protein